MDKEIEMYFDEKSPTPLDIHFENEKRFNPRVLHADANLAVVEKCDYDRATGELSRREIKLVPKRLAEEIALLYNERETAAEKMLNASRSKLRNRRVVTNVLPLQQYTTKEAEELIERLKEEIAEHSELPK